MSSADTDPGGTDGSTSEAANGEAMLSRGYRGDELSANIPPSPSLPSAADGGTSDVSHSSPLSEDMSSLELKPERQSHSVPESRSASTPENELDTEPDPEPDAELERNPRPETDLEFQFGPEPKSPSEFQIENYTDPEPAPGPASQPDIAPDPVSEPGTESELGRGAVANPDPSTDAGDIIEPDGVADVALTIAHATGTSSPTVSSPDQQLSTAETALYLSAFSGHGVESDAGSDVTVIPVPAANIDSENPVPSTVTPAEDPSLADNLSDTENGAREETELGTAVGVDMAINPTESRSPTEEHIAEPPSTEDLIYRTNIDPDNAADSETAIDDGGGTVEDSDLPEASAVPTYVSLDDEADPITDTLPKPGTGSNDVIGLEGSADGEATIDPADEGEPTEAHALSTVDNTSTTDRAGGSDADPSSAIDILKIDAGTELSEGAGPIDTHALPLTEEAPIVTDTVPKPDDGIGTGTFDTEEQQRTPEQHLETAHSKEPNETYSDVQPEPEHAIEPELEPEEKPGKREPSPETQARKKGEEDGEEASNPGLKPDSGVEAESARKLKPNLGLEPNLAGSEGLEKEGEEKIEDGETRLEPNPRQDEGLDETPQTQPKTGQMKKRKLADDPEDQAETRPKHGPDDISASAMKQNRLFADIHQDITELYHSPRGNNQHAINKHYYFSNHTGRNNIHRSAYIKPITGAKGHYEDDFYDVGDVKDTCPACQTHYSRALDSVPFRTSLRLRHNNPWSQTWALGDRYIFTETAEDNQPEMSEQVTLAEVVRLLRENTRVPIPNVLAAWKEDGKVITITERVPGRRLFDMWWELTGAEREDIAREVGGYIEQWRWNYSDAISGVGGGPVHGRQKLLGGADDDTLRSQWRSGGGGFPPCFSDASFWAIIESRLRRGNKFKLDQQTIRFLEDWMPESYPCRLTHGDLSTRNIMVETAGLHDQHGGKPGRRKIRVTAILGFENAASLPTWAEGVCNRFCYCREDEQWKAMLSRHIPHDPLALDWWRLWAEVEDVDARPDRARLRMLKERCRRWPKPPTMRRPFVMPRANKPQVPEMMVQESEAWVGEAELRAAAGGPLAHLISMEAGDYFSQDMGVEFGPSVHKTEPIRFWGQDAVAFEDDDDADNKETDGHTEDDELIRDMADSNGGGESARQLDIASKEKEETYIDEFWAMLNKEVVGRIKDRQAMNQTVKGVETPAGMPSASEEQDSDKTGRPGLRRSATSPHRLLDAADKHEAGRRSRGSSREREPTSDAPSEPGSKRTSMRSFAQKTLRPLTLRTSLRPQSSPAISEADKAKLRSIGEAEAETEGTGKLPGAEPTAAVTIKIEEPRRTHHVLPTIQESPGTPRRPVPPVRRRNRPMSLYGALYAMGKRQRAAMGTTTARGGQGHRRSVSETTLPLANPSKSEGPSQRAPGPSPETPR